MDSLARELSSTPDLARVEFLGGRKKAIRIETDPAKLSAGGISLLDIARALESNEAGAPSGKNWGSRVSWSRGVFLMYRVLHGSVLMLLINIIWISSRTAVILY